MEARLNRFVAVLGLAIAFAAIALPSIGLAASSRTRNFLVTAPTPALAQEIAAAAERYRSDLALEWLGEELPDWEQPCPITAQVGSHLGAGGATSFGFHRGRPLGWTMSIQGSRERVLDSVLPHEVTHTIFATHFGQPLPRWADEGACTTVEHSSERLKQERLLYEFLATERGIAFNHMFAMREYPADILPLYSQGYSLARFLIAQGGKQKFVKYVGDGLETNDWPAATLRNYGYRDLSVLQVTWLAWVRKGMPQLDTQIAQNNVTPSPEMAPTAQVSPVAPTVIAAPLASTDSTPRGFTSLPRPAAIPSSAPPLDQLASANPSDDYRRQGGWYARQREAARPIVAGAPAPRSLLPVPREINAPESAPYQSMARPQAAAIPQQTILQWSPAPTPVAPWAATPLPENAPAISSLPGPVLRR